MPPSKSAEYNRRGDAHHPAAAVPFCLLAGDLRARCGLEDLLADFGLGEETYPQKYPSVMFLAIDIGFEFVALIGSIIFGMCAALWFWGQLH